jgi:hypothetical protein
MQRLGELPHMTSDGACDAQEGEDRMAVVPAQSTHAEERNYFMIGGCAIFRICAASWVICGDPGGVRLERDICRLRSSQHHRLPYSGRCASRDRFGLEVLLRFWAFYTSIPLYLVKVRHMPTSMELTSLATYNIWLIVINYLARWLSNLGIGELSRLRLFFSVRALAGQPQRRATLWAV